MNTDIDTYKQRIFDALDPLEPDCDWLSGSPERFRLEVCATINTIAGDDAALRKRLEDELLGWGPLQPVWDRAEVEELSVNGREDVWVVVGGTREKVAVTLAPGQLMRLVESHLARVGRQISHAQPLVDATLADGARISAQAPGISLSPEGSFTLRRQGATIHTLDSLLQEGQMDARTNRLLRAAVQKQANILVAGSPGAGKTTLVSAMLGEIPSSCRLVSLEDVAELRAPPALNWLGLLSRPAGAEGTGAVDFRALLRIVKRVSPDYIAVGEVRGEGAAELLMAMRAGDGGTLGTIHAADAETAIHEFATLAARGHPNPDLVKQHVVEALSLVIYVSRQRGGEEDGKRRIMEVVRPRWRHGKLEVTPVIRWSAQARCWEFEDVTCFHHFEAAVGDEPC